MRCHPRYWNKKQSQRRLEYKFRDAGGKQRTVYRSPVINVIAGDYPLGIKICAAGVNNTVGDGKKSCASNSYYEDGRIWFPVDATDNRIHPKTFVFGIVVNGVPRAYREHDLKELKVIEDAVAGVRIRLERDDAGIVEITNLETGEEIVKEGQFWFSWVAFHPDTELYDNGL